MMRVMEDEQPADGVVGPGLALRVVDFLDLDRRDVAILREAGVAEARRCPTSPG